MQRENPTIIHADNLSRALPIGDRTLSFAK
jgi:hypothetical protein